MGDYQYKIVVEAGYLTVPDFSCWTKPLLIHDNREEMEPDLDPFKYPQNCETLPRWQEVHNMVPGDYQYTICVEARYFTVPDSIRWTNPLLIHDNWEVNGV